MNGIGYYCIFFFIFNGYDVSSVNQKNVIVIRYCIFKFMIILDLEKFFGLFQLLVEFGYLLMLLV